jgi:hypothetical protein
VIVQKGDDLYTVAGDHESAVGEGGTSYEEIKIKIFTEDFRPITTRAVEPMMEEEKELVASAKEQDVSMWETAKLMVTNMLATLGPQPLDRIHSLLEMCRVGIPFNFRHICAFSTLPMLFFWLN